MRNCTLIGVVLLTALLSGCVSMTDYTALKTEFEQYKAESVKTQKELENKVNMFINAYDPDLHRELDNNLLVSSQYKERIQNILSDMELISQQIHSLMLASQNDRMVISENMKSSVAQNVVNEFSQLKYNWEKIVSDMHQSAIIAQDAASRAQYSAMQAAEKSGAAQKTADIAIATAQEAMKQQPGNGTDVQNRLTKIEEEIQKIKAALNPGKENLSLEMLYNLFRDLNKRVSDLEKNLKTKSSDVSAQQ